MALGEDGKWLGVLKEVILNIPSFTTLQQHCPNLEVLNIGLGLWYSMEAKIETEECAKVARRSNRDLSNDPTEDGNLCTAAGNSCDSD